MPFCSQLEAHKVELLIKDGVNVNHDVVAARVSLWYQISCLHPTARVSYAQGSQESKADGDNEFNKVAAIIHMLIAADIECRH